MSAVRREDGFTLVELIVSLVIAVILMVAVTGTVRGALANSRANRFRQEATSVAMEAFEYSRRLAWDNLAMASIDPQAPLIDPDAGVLLSSETGLPSNEPLLQCPTGAVPAKTVFTSEDVTYTVWLYVTQVNASLRRVYALVGWEMEGTSFTHRSESIVSIVSAGGITAGDQPVFPDAAIVATGNVSLAPGTTQSSPPTAHSASIWLNQSFANLDAVVDGDIVAGGVVNATPANVYGTIEQNAGTPVNVPTVPEIEAWRSAMRAEAVAGGATGGNLVVSGGTLTAPMYVDGTLELQGTVHIAGSGPVYASGLLRLQAGAVVTADGAHLVSDATIVFETGAEYRVAEPTAGGVVAFAASTQALLLRGGDDGTVQGLAYAPYGGILLTGAESWHGTLVAHGSAGLGEVAMSGGIGVVYPANLLPTSAIVNPLRPPPPASVCG
ncbi:MAG: type II secretion system GspH family protein [Actinobacteria bacterium]|nr:type II secretion system GspH family protein [Actinomycetota bacterium]